MSSTNVFSSTASNHKPPTSDSSKTYTVLFEHGFPHIPGEITQPLPNVAPILKASLERINLAMTIIEEVKAQLLREQQRQREENQQHASKAASLNRIANATAMLLHSVHTLAQVAFDPPLEGSMKEIFVEAVRDAFREFKTLQESCQESGVEEFEDPMAAISLELASLIKLLRVVVQNGAGDESEEEANESTHRIAVAINELHAVLDAAKTAAR
jgi:hypothetical protein